MTVTVRKIVQHVEETRLENGQVVEGPHRIAWAAAVIANPYPADYEPDLVTRADALGQEMGALVGPVVVDLLDGQVEAFGKAALVGIEGEVEHGSAIIHNLRFGNVFRTAAEGSELLPAAERIGLMGSSLDVPLKHKVDAKTRSHHQTIPIHIWDAPQPREIVIACVAANTGRPLARLASFGAEVTPEDR